MIATDPVYLTDRYINSEEFVLMERGNQNWLYNCEYGWKCRAQERGAALPARKNPFIEDYAKKFGLPFEAVRGGAQTTYPEYMAS